MQFFRSLSTVIKPMNLDLSYDVFFEKIDKALVPKLESIVLAILKELHVYNSDQGLSLSLTQYFLKFGKEWTDFFDHKEAVLINFCKNLAVDTIQSYVLDAARALRTQSFLVEFDKQRSTHHLARLLNTISADFS